MGVVVLAQDLTLDRPVALKALSGGFPSDEARMRFAREARILLTTRHEALVDLLDACLDQEPPFLVFRYMEGGTLLGRILDCQPAPLPALVECGVRLAGALQTLHDAGILHRDVKPGNVLLDGMGRPYLADLGLGRSDELDPLTRTGALLGTPGYVAPELLAGRPYSPSSDLFALGVTLLEYALGRELHLALGAGGPDASKLEGIADPGVRSLLARATSDRPERRLASAQEFAEEWVRIGNASLRSLPRPMPLDQQVTEDSAGAPPVGPAAAPDPSPPRRPGRPAARSPGPRPAGQTPPGRDGPGPAAPPRDARRGAPDPDASAALRPRSSLALRRPASLGALGRGAAAALLLALFVASALVGTAPPGDVLPTAPGEGTGSAARLAELMAGVQAALEPLLAPHRDPTGHAVLRGGRKPFAYRQPLFEHVTDPRFPLWYRRLAQALVALARELDLQGRSQEIAAGGEGPLASWMDSVLLPRLLWLSSDLAAVNLAGYDAMIQMGSLVDMGGAPVPTPGTEGTDVGLVRQAEQSCEEAMGEARRAMDGEESLAAHPRLEGIHALLTRCLPHRGDRELADRLARHAASPTGRTDWWQVAMAVLSRTRGEALTPEACPGYRPLLTALEARLDPGTASLPQGVPGLLATQLVLHWFQAFTECHIPLDEEFRSQLDRILDRIEAGIGSEPSGFGMAVQYGLTISTAFEMQGLDPRTLSAQVRRLRGFAEGLGALGP